MIVFRDAPSARERLNELALERAAAEAAGLAENALYRPDLDAEIAETETAYVTAAVTEIAVLRAAFDGPLRG